MKIKTDKCSFCNKSTKRVPLLVSSKNAAICSDCILLAICELFKQYAERIK